MIYDAKGAIIDRLYRMDAVRGGFAVVLLTRDSPENSALCEAFRSRLDLELNPRLATWKVLDGQHTTTRPIYWPVNNLSASAGPRPSCSWLLSSYDYKRATTLLRRLNLKQRGPYLLVANWKRPSGDVRLGGFHLADVPDSEIATTFDDFSNYFAQHEDRWNADLLVQARLRQRIKVFLDRDIGPRIWLLAGLPTAANAEESEQ